MVKKQPYHIVEYSLLPLIVAAQLLCLPLAILMFLKEESHLSVIITLTFLCLLILIWCRDISREACYKGEHTKRVERGFFYATLFFILSELIFFFSLFWAFLAFSLSPDISIGMIWPPLCIVPLRPLGVPLINTLILLLRGLTVTLAHGGILKGKKRTRQLVRTIMLGWFFLSLQIIEYGEANFDFTQTAFSCIFYILTGCHGFHVFIGRLFLLGQTLRLKAYNFRKSRHRGLQFSIWYWHFVDVVWLFVFVLVYSWGSSS